MGSLSVEGAISSKTKEQYHTQPLHQRLIVKALAWETATQHALH